MCLNGLGYFFEYIYFISENIFYNIEICVHPFKNPKLKIYIKEKKNSHEILFTHNLSFNLVMHSTKAWPMTFVGLFVKILVR